MAEPTATLRQLDALGAGPALQEVNDALIAALRHPDAEAFSRALDLLHDAAGQRPAVVQEAGVEAAAGVGEADLRRLKRQFSSLKNTFLHYEVKNEFLAELLDGRPHGDEGELLQHFEAEVEASISRLRQLKAANEGTQAAISDVVAQIAAAHDGLERQRAAVAGELARLQQDVAQHEADMGQPLPELPEGPGQDECQVALGACTSEARELEAAIAAQLAEAEELEAAIAAEREEAEALRAQLGHLESQTAAQGERVEANARFLSTAQWCDEVASTLTLLGGLSLLHVAPGAVHLKLVTPFPTGPVRGDDPGPCTTADHELSLHLSDDGAVSSAQLTPADVDVCDVVEAAREGRRPLDYVVREVQARLGPALHRRALVEEVKARFEVASESADSSSVRARLAQGVEAEVRLVASWPDCADTVQVSEVAGGPEALAPKLDKAAQLRFQGRSLAQALEAVERELA